MIDFKKLKGAMVIAGYNQTTLAKAVGMTENTLSAKFNGKSKVSTDEAKIFCEVLGIKSDAEKVAIFLA